MLPLLTADCDVDEHCLGERWEAADEDQLAALVALIAMGQAAQAAFIIENMSAAEPAFSFEALRSEAKITLSVQDPPPTGRQPRTGYPRTQRDGFIFEAISWIAARQKHGTSVLLKDPHVSSTTQGLDGLMLEMDGGKTGITRTTIFEDKCTDNPEDTFAYKVMKAFQDRHQNSRNAEIVAVASTLLRMAGIGGAGAAKMSAQVTSRSTRRYRAAFAVTTLHDSKDMRAALFTGYHKLGGLQPEQRVGACLVVPPKLRDWLDAFAAKAVAYLDALEDDLDV